MKKGFEMSMNVVIIAALLLILLVVVIMIFSNYMGKGNDDMEHAQEGDPCPTDAPGCVGASYEKTECGTGEIQLVGNFKQVYERGKVCCCKKE